jgi:hypothetical protein
VRPMALRISGRRLAADRRPRHKRNKKNSNFPRR